MAYTVLARKYRSQSFDDVVGQDPVSQTLKNAIKTGRVAHAFLFVGTRGVGKTTMARILAKALNCLKTDAPTIEPCCKCQSCIAINTGEDIDVIEIDGASNNGVEQVRELRQNAIYRPARGRYKIYIIDEVHMLSVPAFNALLKILEEPPEHVKFIFATTEPNKVIPTIQSRCQRFDFCNIGPVQIAQHLKFVLKEEKIKFEDDLIIHLSKMANGSMRDALSLLDRLISTCNGTLTVNLLEECLGCPDSEKIYNLIENIGSSDAVATLQSTDELITTGMSEVQIVDSLIDNMRDLMVFKSTAGKANILILTEKQKEHIAQLAEKFDLAALVYNITTLEKMRWTIKNSDSARALLEACMLRFALSEHFLNVDQLLKQIKSMPTLKKKLTNPPQPTTADLDDQSATAADINIPDSNIDLQYLKDNWNQLLDNISEELGKVALGILKLVKPVSFESGNLTVEFKPADKMSMDLCKSNGRAENILRAFKNLSEQFRHIDFATEKDADSDKPKASSEQKEQLPQKSGAQLKNGLINDPAVKAVLMEFEATVTDIRSKEES
ncbi:MAG: DNA polymerase III subunit gamma/tau [Planctomycetes bacterium]|nr:DNA polymerase III subunit gamma/tau [Planctomycetota bacterium]